jgi:hypothetical protein
VRQHSELPLFRRQPVDLRLDPARVQVDNCQAPTARQVIVVVGRIAHHVTAASIDRNLSHCRDLGMTRDRRQPLARGGQVEMTIRRS